MIVPPWVKLLALAGAVLLIWGHGYRTGAAGVRAEWADDQLAAERATRAQEAAQRRRALDASTGYQQQAAKRAAAQHSLAADIQTALSTPACPKEAPDALQLADLVIPGPALDRLRRAGADAVD